MKNLKQYILFLLCLSFTVSLSAREPDKESKPQGTSLNTRIDLRTDCVQSTESTDLQINNVRARLWVGGDIWWNRSQGRYIVPKPATGSGIDEVSSLYAGGVWLGGFDPSGNLKLAGSTYPNNGDPDFYPGPLDDDTGLTSADVCQQWDQFFKVLGTDIKKAIRDYDTAKEAGLEYQLEAIPDSVLYWPGQGNVYFEQEYGFELPNTTAGLGAFWDENENEVYDPENGDFPIIDIRGCEPDTRLEAKELIPDEMLFWIYNDAGNTHFETFGNAINMEVQVQGFAYATNDEINDMTFLRYKLINRAKEDIRQTYFAMWVDPDLGCDSDDFIGCDVDRSLAYTYNVDEIDGDGNTADCGGTPTYGSTVPIIGTDYFRGPIAPKVIVCDSSADMHIVTVADRFSKLDSICGNPPLEVGDTIYIRDPDLAAGEKGDFGFELGMSSFIYHNREGGDAAQRDPQNAEQYYSYLEGRWLDQSPLTVGGDGFNPGSTDFTRYAFPDEPNDPNGWSMCTGEDGGPLFAGDRRTIQASGPFLLQPGAVNELIIGAVWVPDVNYPCPDIRKLTAADDIAQNLFDNCFDIVDGPDAPTVCPVALDQEIILVLHNDEIESNNRNYSYMETDVFSPMFLDPEDRLYVFEGYKIFQLAGPNVSPQELDDIDKARIVAQVDVNNGITEIYNWTSSSDPNASVTGNTDFIWTPELMVSGRDAGIQNTFRLTRDIFAAGDSRLINHKKYYYMALAYAHNEFEKFNPNNSTLSQARPYLEGRGNVRTYTVTPRPIVYEGLNAQYGDGVKITRIRGVGVGGNIIDMDDDMHDLILSGDFPDEGGNNSQIRYKEGAGPIDVKVYNPLEVRDGKFQLEILGDHDSGPLCALEDNTRWRLTNLDDGTVFESDTDINTINEQLVPEYGISLNILQANTAGTALDNNNGALAATIEYEGDDAIRWYEALQDEAPNLPQLGAIGREIYDFMLTDEPDIDPQAAATDPLGRFTNLGDGYWYPFMLCSSAQKDFDVPYITPAWNESGANQEEIRPIGQRNVIVNIGNVDIVMTSDKDKWSRCMVVETGSEFYISDQPLQMLGIKDLPSVDKNGNADNVGDRNDPNSSNYIEDLYDGISGDVGKTGYSWFPGYAIDVETGKRLNLFFGENGAFNSSYSRARNVESLDSIFNDVGNFVRIDTTYNETPLRFAIGNDMLYNPTDDFLSSTINNDLSEVVQNTFLGGQHFIYVTREEYDGCSAFGNELATAAIPFFAKRDIYKSITWCSMSYLAQGSSILSYEEGIVPSDVTIKLRVNKPYNKETQFDLSFSANNCDIVDGELGGLPVYEFEIQGKESVDLTQDEYEGALANVNVSPNPYYAYSAYELDQFTKTVKITNLPDRAIVTIYSLDGKFIKQFNRDERTIKRDGANPGVINSQTTSAIEWDLENIAGIPVASGVYLIHVDAPDLGEQRTLKWFGVNRKFDPSGL